MKNLKVRAKKRIRIRFKFLFYGHSCFVNNLSFSIKIYNNLEGENNISKINEDKVLVIVYTRK